MGRASKDRDYDYDTYRESIFLTQYCGWLCHIRKHGSNCRFIGPVYIGVFLAKNSLIKGMSFTSGAQNGKYEIAINSSHLPAHSHTMHIFNSGTEASGYGLNPSSGFQNRVMVASGESNKQWSTGSSGIGANFGIMQPYLAVYFWKRTA